MAKEQVIKNLVWIDMEMTGLEPVSNQILQVACLVTDTNLNILEGSLDIAIHCDESRLQQMNDWNREHHTQTGLWQRCLTSEITTAQAEQQVIEFVSKYVGPQESPLCGNSITQDRVFVQLYMPELQEYLHYRCVDVSTIKQLYLLWSGKPKFTKADTHDAISDITESVAELAYYRREFLNIAK